MTRTQLLVSISAGMVALAGSWAISPKTPPPSSLSTAGLEADPFLEHLSAAQLDALLSGEDLGFTRAVEQYMTPSPRAVLALAGPLALTEEQLQETRRIAAERRRLAVEAGRAVIDAERSLGRAMRSLTGGPEDARTLEAFDAAADAWRRLRRVHIEAHMRTLGVLTPEQVGAYQEEVARLAQVSRD